MANSGFRANKDVDKKVAGSLFAAKKAESLLQWTILRGDREAPPATVLDAGETVRLRIRSLLPGALSLTEGEKVLATMQVEASGTFDTPPIPFTVPGERLLRLSVVVGAGPPLTVSITLHYAR